MDTLTHKYHSSLATYQGVTEHNPKDRPWSNSALHAIDGPNAASQECELDRR